VFVKDSGEIWTHGNLYKSVNWENLGDAGEESFAAIVTLLNAEY
jgi:hypothetical protein